MKKISALVLTLLIGLQTLVAQTISKAWVQEHYTKTEVMVPMRDGISLYTSIYTPLYTPEDKPSGKPIIMHRTPYGCKPYGKDFRFLPELRNYFGHGYIVVMQDVRGRYMSEGKFINLEERPEDTWDTVDWLLEHVEGHNGKVGLTGYSYPGYYAMTGALSRHPAIKAVAPQAPVLDWYLGDDAHHNGVFMLLDTYFFGRNFYRPCPNPTPSMPAVQNRIDRPVYDFFLDKLTFRNITATFPEPLEFWNEMAEHPDYDDWWKAKTRTGKMHDLKAAVLVVGGAYDTDDCYGALHTWRNIREQSPDTPLYLVYGPWYHGGWRHEDAYLDQIEFPFFEHYLNDGPETLPELTVIPSQHSKGAVPEAVTKGNGRLVLESTTLAWKMEKKTYYLQEAGRLDRKRPGGRGMKSVYTSDPHAPVPHFPQPLLKKDKTYMIADQRFASERNDVLTFATTPLADTLKLVGPVDVDLQVRCSAEDADFVVKVIDAAPDGHQMLVRWEVLRARYRKGFSCPVPMDTAHVERIRFRMPDLAHYLLPGHRLMVQIQSSFFPVIDLNPGKFIPNIYKASEADFRSAEIEILHDRKHPSRLTFFTLGRLRKRP